MKQVAVLDDYQGVALSCAPWDRLAGRAEVTVFRDHLADPDAVVERLRGFDAVVLNRERTPMPREVIDRLPRLECIVTSGKRNASVDVRHAVERGLTVSGAQTLGHPSAELAWALILAFMRRIPEEAADVRAGGWQVSLGRDLRGKTLAIAGLGRIGKVVAQVGVAFGMNVIAWSRSLTPEAAAPLGVRAVDKETLFREADVLSLHLGLNAGTRGIVDAAALALMKPTALVVNTARGELIDDDALIAALDAGGLGGAALDVFAEEPLPQDHPYRRRGDVLVTPHLGYVTEDNYRTSFGEVVEDLEAWLAGAPIRAIDPESRA
jgi:phosphoglycerate dehydrogenase-like enzyme